jgi:hypothetical protein
MGVGAALIGLAAGDTACQRIKNYKSYHLVNKKRAPASFESLHSTERILSQEAPITLFRLDMPTELNYLALNLN